MDFLQLMSGHFNQGLRMKCVPAKFIPLLLTQEQKGSHFLPASSNLLEYVETNENSEKYHER
jgi:hypothetical protein